MQLLQ
jgi:hypothetical protein